MPDNDNHDLTIKPDKEGIGDFSYKQPPKEVKPPQTPPPPPPTPTQTLPQKPTETKKDE